MPTRPLADGHELPMLGLGVWQIPDGPECVDAVLAAFAAGYRHIDTAQAYGNESSVGQALAQSGLARQEYFLTTKFNPGGDDPVADAQRSLERLGVDYVDLYLVHWVQGGPTWAWPGMEAAHEKGYTRSIGVSNFDTEELPEVIAIAQVPPVVNQIELNPFAYRRALVAECERHAVVPEGYSPLGTGQHLGDATVQRIAEQTGRTAAQVLLRWSVQHGFPVLPKSTHRERIEENAQIFDFELSDADMQELDALDQTGGTGRAGDDEEE
jgi:diketogulonate reductase-like aldo/keto reductase